MPSRRRRLPLRLPAAEPMGNRQWLIGRWCVYCQPNGLWIGLVDSDDDECADIPPLFGESLQAMRWLIASWDRTMLVREGKAAVRVGRRNASLEHRANLLDDLISEVAALIDDPVAEQHRQLLLQQRVAAAAEAEEQRKRELCQRVTRSRQSNLDAAIDRELAKVWKQAVA